MITLQELCIYLDKLLQPAAINDFCINGVQIEGSGKITKLATAVSANLKTIEAAVEWGAQALIVHHGLFWNRDSHEIRGVKKEKISLLLKYDISLLTYHLPLDVHKEIGNNWKAALDMGWTDLEPFGNEKGLSIGVKGRFPAVTREVFQKQIEQYYQHQAHVALGGKEKVESAAIISGGSYKFIDQAVADGVDCFIAGNFDEPAWSQAHEEKINFYSMGHSATERVGPIALCEHLQSHFSVECKFIDIFNPF